jgi:hypothetical protein
MGNAGPGSSFAKAKAERGERASRDRKAQEAKESGRARASGSGFSGNGDADTILNQNLTGSGHGTIAEEPQSKRDKYGVEMADSDQDPGRVNQLILAQQEAERKRQK